MKKTTSRVILVKINKVVGTLYLPSKETNRAIIAAKGGPSFGDIGNSSLWPIAKKDGYILFIPDYIGCCRSDGQFNFANCLETIYEAEDFLKGKTTATNVESNQKIHLNCSKILLLGSSWGGAIVPFLEKYRHSQIVDILLVKPLLDWATQGQTKYLEEDVSLTNQVIIQGWKNLYREYENSEWPKIFQGQSSEYNPIDNIGLLKNKHVYICHGRQDKTINWHKSYNYYNKFLSLYPQATVHLQLVDGDHSSEFTAEGLKNILNLKKKEANTLKRKAAFY